MAAVAGLRGTGDWATDERPKNFREMIMKRNPNGTAPMFALMARVAKESVDDPEFAWWDEPNDLVRLQVNGAVGSTTADQLITVDSTDPDTTTPDAHWGLAKHLVPGDLLLVEPAADAATFNHEVIRVTAVLSDTQFMVDRAVAGTSIAAIANDAFLLKIGSHFAEGTGAPTAATRNPQKYYNYTQIFKTTYEITGTAEQTRTRTGDPVKNDKMRRAFDHSRDMELAFLFGERSETTGVNGKPLRTTRGLRRWIPGRNVDILTTGWGIANVAGNNLLDIVSKVFDFDTPAGDERIAFCGNGTLNQINSAIHKASGVAATTINWAGSETVYGMNFKRLSLPQGNIFLKTHPLMNRHTLYNYGMFIIDFSALRYRPMKGRDTKTMDNIQNKDEDVRRGQWITECGLELRYGGLTCGYVGGFNTVPA